MWYSLVVCLVCMTHGKKPVSKSINFLEQITGHSKIKGINAEVAFMKFWQIDGGNVQEGFSSSTYPTHSSSSSSTPSIEEIPSYTEDVKYELLKYQLDIAIEQQNHAMKIAKLNAKMLNAVASQVLHKNELNQMAHLNLVE